MFCCKRVENAEEKTMKRQLHESFVYLTRISSSKLYTVLVWQKGFKWTLNQTMSFYLRKTIYFVFVLCTSIITIFVLIGLLSFTKSVFKNYCSIYNFLVDEQKQTFEIENEISPFIMISSNLNCKVWRTIDEIRRIQHFFYAVPKKLKWICNFWI